MMEVTRLDAFDSGELIDYSDIAREAGFVWDVAASEVLERKLQATLPDEQDMRVLEAMLSSGLYALLLEAHKRLINARANPGLMSRNRLDFAINLPWKPQEWLEATLVIGPDDEDRPFFTLYHPSEL